MGQEAESEWKVSGVRQMLVQWTVGRMCVCPSMVLLRLTVAGRVAPMSSDPSGFFDTGVMISCRKCLVPAGDPPALLYGKVPAQYESSEDSA